MIRSWMKTRRQRSTMFSLYERLLTSMYLSENIATRRLTRMTVERKTQIHIHKSPTKESESR